jgi:hypothetical protein
MAKNMENIYLISKENRMRLVLSTVLAIALMQNLPLKLFGQALPKSKAESTISREVKEKGWSIAEMGLKHFDQAKMNSRREVDIRAGVKVVETSFFPSDNGKILEDGSGMVYNIRQYSIDNKAFCYLIKVEPAFGGGYLSMVDTYAYYDDDGDGVFRVKEKIIYQPYRDIYNPNVKLPKWVEQEISKKK